MSLLYDLFFIIFSVLYFPYFLIKGKWRDFSLQRLGIYSADVLSKLKDRNPIWIHAVSVGEVMATAPLYEEIKKDYPSESIVVSTVTLTGNRIATDRFGSGSIVIYLPLDLSLIVKRVVKLINPKAILIAETEIWPNLINSLKCYGAKVILFNGRISKSSFKGYRLITPILRRILDKFDILLMQTKRDAEKIISLGAPEDRVRITGNLKYDAAFSKGQGHNLNPVEPRSRFNLSEEAQLLIAGSTHPGEEEIILRCYKALINEYPQLRLLIAPRHIERAKDLVKLAKGQGFNSFLISQLKDVGKTCLTVSQRIRQDEILILDVMGKLFEAYSRGDIIFVGGSLVKKGGQNPLEAAYHSKAIIFGPHTYNFEDITEALLSNRAAILVKDETELKNSIRGLLNNPAELKAIGERARRTVYSNIGVAKSDLRIIEGLNFLKDER